MALGRGSDIRRKGIINAKLAGAGLFEGLMAQFKQRFRTLADDFETDVQGVIDSHLTVVVNTLNLVRDDNVAVESESDPDFRRRVESRLGVVRDEIHQVISRIIV